MRIKLFNKGATLVELLVFIAVLSVLAITSAIVIPPSLDNAYDARRKTDLHKIKMKLEAYYDDAGNYPKDLPDCGEPLEYESQKVLSSIPCDPTTREPYVYQAKGGEPQHYRLYTLLANEQNFSISDVGCDGGCGPDCFYNYGVSSTNVNLVRCSYVCAPGGGQEGTCELYQNASRSSCPALYGRDPTCNGECVNQENKCDNASGKNVPD